MARRSKKSKSQSLQLKDGVFQIPTSKAAHHWARATGASVDVTNASGYSAILDLTHLRAHVEAKQVASQFGHMLADVEVFVYPASSGADTESLSGISQLTWLAPTRNRYAALSHLKTLETWDDTVAVEMEHDEAYPEVNPLLSIPLDGDTVEIGGDLTAIPRRGLKIVRFGFDVDTPTVYQNSAFTFDINEDGDADDLYERQWYVLDAQGTTEDDEKFGILNRYEENINPGANSGQALVHEQWAYPMSNNRVLGLSQECQPISWNHDDALGQARSTMPTTVATFRNIECIGGLMKLTFPFWSDNGQLEENNDFLVGVNVRLKKWTPMN